MAFNFLGNNSYQVKVGMNPYEQQNIYNDPRRQGSVGSFNPSALNFYSAAGQPKGGMNPNNQPGGNNPNNPPQVPPVNNNPPPPPPPGGAPSTGSRVNPGDPNNPGTPYNGVDPPGARGVRPGQGAINYGAFPTVQAAYASFPGGTPPAGWDWQEWARVNNAPDPARHTASGEPITFTWNPNGGGYINPQTGQTYDRYGETVPR